MKQKVIVLILLFLASLGLSQGTERPAKNRDVLIHAPAFSQSPVPLIVYGPETFIQKNTEGVQKEISIPICDPGLPYRLTVRNGDEESDHKAAFLTLVLNGKTILDSTAFREEVREITLGVEVQRENTLLLTFSDGIESQITLTLFVPEEHSPLRLHHFEVQPGIVTPDGDGVDDILTVTPTFRIDKSFLDACQNEGLTLHPRIALYTIQDFYSSDLAHPDLSHPYLEQEKATLLQEPLTTKRIRDEKGKSRTCALVTVPFTASHFTNGRHIGVLSWTLTDKSAEHTLSQNHQEFFFKVTGAQDSAQLRNDLQFPSESCENGFDVSCSRNGLCYQCAASGTAHINCKFDLGCQLPAQSYDPPGFYCWGNDWYRCDGTFGDACYTNLDSIPPYCWENSTYINEVNIDSADVSEDNGEFNIAFNLSYSAPCVWTFSYQCTLASLCLMTDPALDCSTGSILTLGYCRPRYEKGTWTTTISVACTLAGSTITYYGHLDKCANQTYTSDATSAPYPVTFPEPMEADCSAPPDWECCTDDSGSQCVGGPVNVASGNVSYAETDITLSNTPFEIPFTRSYNSQETHLARTGGVFGYGWTHPFNQRLEQSNTLSDSRRVFRLVNGEGKYRYYTEDSVGSNTFSMARPTDLMGSIASDGTYWVVRDKMDNQNLFFQSGTTAGMWH